MPARRSLHYAFTNTDAFCAAADMTASDTALMWLERERHNLAAAVRESASREWWELAHDLADALQPLFLLHKHYRDAAELGEIATSAAVAWGNAAAENNMRKRLARTYVRLGELDQAAQHARIMLASARANADRRAEASALKSRALVLEAQGAVESAAQALHEAVALLRSLGRIRGEGIALIDLGGILALAGRHEEGQACLEQARAILVGLDPADMYNASRAAVALAQVYLESGRDVEAQQLLPAAVEALAQMGADREQARAYRLLAELARRTGDTESARRHDDAAAALLATPVDGAEQD
jgi:tetratricopeptide (TPR) repeat protein